jgi:adenylate cyclase class 1
MPLTPTHPDSATDSQRSHLPIDEQDIQVGLDRINLTELRTRFLSINDTRSERLREGLLPTQGIFLDLLPLLFHINNPALPGYYSSATPAGIRNFKVAREHIKAARSLAKSFSLQRDPHAEAAISAIYLMGSCGSLAHNNRSDLDIWVCPTTELEGEALDALTKKCNSITAWAATLCLEVHFFVMHDEAFRHQRRAAMDKEDCGRTQHFLLLDEFYRTAMLVAGSTPLWWFVPQSFDADYNTYTNTLLKKRYVDELANIDFGSANNIPFNEYISAGIWQLYKGIESPYKALLKLLLIETYAAKSSDEYLSGAFKRRVYEGGYTIDELDPYLQVFRRVENYLLQNNETARLELARRCLYFKVGIKLSRAPDEATPIDELGKRLNQPKYWRRNLMHKLVAEWGWRRPQLLKLDQRENWPFNEVRTEQQLLIKELIGSYRLLTNLVKQQRLTDVQKPATMSSQDSLDLNILGRQLYAMFEQKPHKVPRITSAVTDSTAQELIYLKQESNPDGKPIWVAETIGIHRESIREVIKKSESPAEILVWCITNGLATNSTRFKIDAGEHDLTEYEVRQLATSLINQLPVRKSTLSDLQLKTDFAKPARITKNIFIANCGIDPLKTQKNHGAVRISNKADPLAYSGIEENLIESITLITVNSWQETFCYHFTGAETLNECLVHFFAMDERIKAPPQSATTPAQHGVNNAPTRSVLCACSSQPRPIANRLSDLLDSIEACYFQSASEATPNLQNETRNARGYVFQSAKGFHIFSWQHQRPLISLMESEKQLLEHLSQPNSTSPVTIDSYALQDHPLSTVCRLLEVGKRDSIQSGQQNRIRVFYEADNGYANTYLTDQNNALCFARIPYESTRALILPLRQFIESSSLRHAASASIDVNSMMAGHDIPDIEFFVLQKSGSNYTAVQVPTEANISARYVPIKAVGALNAAGDIDWIIHCNDELFEQSVLGEQLFPEVAAAIKRFRTSDHSGYRCYINDIEVEQTNNSAMTLAHDFYYKNQLEEALNLAFTQLHS